MPKLTFDQRWYDTFIATMPGDCVGIMGYGCHCEVCRENCAPTCEKCSELRKDFPMTQNPTNDMSAEELGTLIDETLTDWQEKWAQNIHPQIYNDLVDRFGATITQALKEKDERISELESQNALLVEALSEAYGMASERSNIAFYGAFAKVSKDFAMEQFGRVADRLNEALTNTTQQAQARDKRIRAEGFNAAIHEFSMRLYGGLPLSEWKTVDEFVNRWLTPWLQLIKKEVS